MAKLSILVAVAAICSLVSGAYNPDEWKEIKFHKSEDGSDEYDIKYKLDNGKDYSGQTINVSDRLYFIFGANDVIYSVEIDKNEVKDENEFTKAASVVERNGDSFTIKAYLNNYELDIAKNYLLATPYATEWDVENICFNRTNGIDQTFNYTISSLNNPRKYTGTTYRETDDFAVQRIHLEDGNQHVGIYEIEFTENELRSSEVFCRGISKLISVHGVLGIIGTSNINANVLKSLAG